MLITGGATGIGFALARALVNLDNEVIICGRRHELLRKARSEVPALHIKVCDVSRGGSRAALVGWATERFKSLNILINKPGVQCVVDFTKGPREARRGV